MRYRFAAVACAAGLALGACGGSDEAAVTAPSKPVESKLPGSAELTRLVSNSFRMKLRQLSLITGVSGETGDIGQPVATGLVDRVVCRRASCVVDWTDVLGRGQRTHYAVSPSRECFSATARPALAALYDVNEGAQMAHPLQELDGARPC